MNVLVRTRKPRSFDNETGSPASGTFAQTLGTPLPEAIAHAPTGPIQWLNLARGWIRNISCRTTRIAITKEEESKSFLGITKSFDSREQLSISYFHSNTWKNYTKELSILFKIPRVLDELLLFSHSFVFARTSYKPIDNDKKQVRTSQYKKHLFYDRQFWSFIVAGNCYWFFFLLALQPHGFITVILLPCSEECTTSWVKVCFIPFSSSLSFVSLSCQLARFTAASLPRRTFRSFIHSLRCHLERKCIIPHRENPRRSDSHRIQRHFCSSFHFFFFFFLISDLGRHVCKGSPIGLPELQRTILNFTSAE